MQSKYIVTMFVTDCGMTRMLIVAAMNILS